MFFFISYNNDDDICPNFTGFLIESFVTNFDTYEKHKKESLQKPTDTNLSHAMELRVLAARTKEIDAHRTSIELYTSRFGKETPSERTAVQKLKRFMDLIYC